MSRGMVYNIQRMSTEDGPGLRTTVFLKGCPLRCLWCSNPESQKTPPQMLFFEALCVGCGACAALCPHGAARLEDGKCTAKSAQCQDCGLCAEGCEARARDMVGKSMSVDEVMAIVRKDALFYANSDGGVTLGGGEPTAAGQFFLDLAEAVLNEGYHLTVDTCGFCPEERFAKVLSLADLLLFDCKHMIPEEHARLTGQDNALILRNISSALQSRAKVRIRMPLMPGMNDGDENLALMADFLGKFGRQEVEIMPCHSFGKGKYAALGEQCPQVEAYTPESLKAVLARFEEHGLKPVLV